MPERATKTGEGYEKRDIDLKGVAGFGLALVLLAAASLGGLWGMLVHLSHSEPSQKVSGLGIGEVAPSLPPGFWPSEIGQEDTQIAASQRALLSSYRTVDPKQGTVAVPIERAIELLVARSRAAGGPHGR